MSRLTAIAAITLCWIVSSFSLERAPAFAEGRSILDLSEPDPSPPEEAVEYAEVSDDVIAWEPYDDEPFPPDSPGDGPIRTQEFPSHANCGPRCELPDVENADFASVERCDGCRCGYDCSGHSVRHGNRWFAEVGAAALQSDMATSEFESWPDDFGSAGRITIGREWESGIGIRAQAWAYTVQGNILELPLAQFYSTYGFYSLYRGPGAVNQLLYYDPYYSTNLNYVNSMPIELNATTAFLDIYKSSQFRNGELSVGMGPAFSHLRFSFPPSGNGVRYNGGGVSLSGDGYYSFMRRNRWELGITGRSRLSLLTGHWKVETAIMENEPNDSMSILELGIGPELRFRLDPTADRYGFLQGLAEFHQWRSDRMGPTAGDTLGLQGASLNLGVLW